MLNLTFFLVDSSLPWLILFLFRLRDFALFFLWVKRSDISPLTLKTFSSSYESDSSNLSYSSKKTVLAASLISLSDFYGSISSKSVKIRVAVTPSM